MACDHSEGHIKSLSASSRYHTEVRRQSSFYTQNQSENIILITRILLCQRYNGSISFPYSRLDYPSLTYTNNFERVEQGITYLQYQAISAQAEADGRNVSCKYDL